MTVPYPEGFEDLNFGEFREELLQKIDENRTVDLRIASLRDLVSKAIEKYPRSGSQNKAAS